MYKYKKIIKKTIIIFFLFFIIMLPKVLAEKDFSIEPIYVYKYNLENKNLEKKEVDKIIHFDGKSNKFFSVEKIFNEFKKQNTIIKNAKFNNYKITYQKHFYDKNDKSEYYCKTAMYLDLSPDFLIDNISKDEEKLLLESLYKTMISKFHYIDRIYININGIPYKSVNYSFKYKVAFLEENIDFSKFELNYKDEKVIHSYHDSSQEDYQDDDSNELGGFWWAEMYEKEKKEKSDLANGY